MTTSIQEIRTAAEHEADEYRAGADRPLAGYGRVVATYGATVVAGAAFVRWRRVALPERVSAADIALVGVATAKLSRLIARDPVTSPFRAPFTRFEGTQGPAELKEEPRGSGARHAIGELVTCPFCLSQWVATGFAFGLVLAPRVTRQIAGVFASLELADLLQYARTGADKLAE
jgi:hypothetical protein